MNNITKEEDFLHNVIGIIDNLIKEPKNDEWDFTALRNDVWNAALYEVKQAILKYKNKL